jgi:hypothetical protein
MKKLAIVCTIIGLCTGYALSAENEKEEGKKAPPGLQKKGGVPPGQAKKKGQADEASPAEAPAAVTPANAPASANTPAAPAASAPVASTATAKPAAAPAKPATLAEQKSVIDNNMRTINQATKSNPAMHKVALQHISKETGIPIEHLREQDKNFPDATDTALLLANVIAKQSGTKFRDIYHARDNGKHWAEIAKAHSVDVALVVQKSAGLAQALRAAQSSGTR